jgi:hypothetical protein
MRRITAAPWRGTRRRQERMTGVQVVMRAPVFLGHEIVGVDCAKAF